MNKGFTLDGTLDPNKVGQAFVDLIGKAMVEQMQKTQTVGNPVGPYLHGPGGLFGVRGLKRGVISTHTQITGSLGEMIPVGATGAVRDSATNELNPLFPYITGFLRSDQDEKNAVCDDPPEAAGMKTCILTAQFGRKEFKTRQVEVNHIGQVINRGEFTDLVLENSPLVNQMGGLMSNFFNGGMNNANAILAGREMLIRFVEVGVAFQRWFCPQVFTGNPSNNSAGGGYKEFPGLDLLIGTNKVDALAGTACPSLYSDVKDFGYRQVDSSVDPTLIKTLTTMMHILNRKAITQNLGPVDFRLVMRSEMFYFLTEIWACNYQTYRCFNFDTANIDPVGAFSVETTIRMKEDMRNGSYLLIDGRRYPVIQDDCIMEEDASDNQSIPVGCYASDIYIVPFSARGGTLRTLYWEYFNYNSGPLQAIQDIRGTNYFWTDNGIFLWGVKPPDVWCIEAIAKVEPRIILRTPQLAGRLQNVTYCPLQHADDPLPSQPYHLNGGVSTGYPTPSPFSEWNNAGPGIGA
jgi:hypothetical protein